MPSPADTAAVEQHTGKLAKEHALRTADAVHLASSPAIGDPDLVVAAWDRRLHAGAQAACASHLYNSTGRTQRKAAFRHSQRTNPPSRYSCYALRLAVAFERSDGWLPYRVPTRGCNVGLALDRGACPSVLVMAWLE
jgi:hypothetical protein